jgi:hypothetical protein
MAAARKHPRDDELTVVLARLFDLSPRDQLRAYESLRDYLALAAPAVDDKLERQLDALKTLEQVRDELGHVPTMEEFDRAAIQLGIDWNAQRIGRVFGGFKAALAFLTRERPRPSAGQEAKRRAAVGRGRTHEAYKTALRVWLDTKPESEGVRDYTAFAGEYNRGRSELWLPSASAIKKGLTLPWKECLRLARDETTLADATKAMLAARESRTTGPHDLIGVREIGALLDLSETATWQLTLSDGFPPAALLLGEKRGFVREHVEAYREGQRQWSHKRNYLRSTYLDVYELATAIAVKPSAASTRSPATKYPPATGMVAGRRYWLKVDVAAWTREHADLVARRRARPGAEPTMR